MQYTELYLDSAENTKIFVRKWQPESDIKACLQISHGMAEHSGRYTEFAEFMANNGVAVYANDHRGHGKTAGDISKLGFLAPKNGWQLVVDDVKNLADLIAQENPGKPLFLLGHSFGSIVARAFMARHGNTFKAIIFSGTPAPQGFLVELGKIIASIQGSIKGKDKPSKLLNDMSFKDYNRAFKPNKTDFDWLSRDEEKNKNYIDDPYCGTIFTNGFYYDMLSMISFVENKNYFKKIDKDIPLIFLSGSKDPVGGFGKGVEKVYNNYKNAGVQDIELKLYEDGRHEMLNEINRKEVYDFILSKLKKYI